MRNLLVRSAVVMLVILGMEAPTLAAPRDRDFWVAKVKGKNDADVSIAEDVINRAPGAPRG